MKVTATEIMRTVVSAKFPPRRYAVCPNVSWSILPWEADLLVVSPSGISHEVEIKVTVADLWRDRHKRKWQGEGPHAYVDYFWYAVPQGMESEALERAREVGAGVMVVGHAYHPDIILQPKRSRRVKSDAVTAAAIHRLAGLRFWDTVLKVKQEDEHGVDQKGEGEAGVVEIHTESQRGKNEAATIHKSFEEPHPALVNAMADAVKSVFSILEWDRSYAAGAVKVTGASFSESEKGIRGAVITGQVALNTADSPFCFNTPHLPFEPYAEGAGGRVMERVDVDRMELILEEAQAFLGGKRAPPSSQK
jgi:hypothetical protein